MNSFKNKITIGITAYNEGEYLLEAWNSVSSQTNDSWEAIMVLDGGADVETQRIFNNISHPSLQKIKLDENMGPYPARTMSIEKANSEWYCQLDADDILPSNTINLLLDTINSNPKSEYIYGNCIHFNDHSYFVKKPLDDPDLLCYSALFNSASPIKKSLYDAIGGYALDLYYNADWDFWISVHELGINGTRINDIIYCRRVRSDNIGAVQMDQKPINVEIIIKKHPIYFDTEFKKNKARFKVYEILARNKRALGARNIAYEYANRALQYGSITSTLSEIIKEYHMSLPRYLLRRIRRWI